MITDPFSIELVARVRGPGVCEASGLFLEAVAAVGIESPVEWARANGVWKAARSVESSLATLRRNPGTPPAANWRVRDRWIVGISAEDDEEGVWICHFAYRVHERDVPAGLGVCAAILRYVAEKGQLVRAFVERENGGVLCLPEVPFAGFNANIVVSPPERLRLGYDDPEKFISAGWRREQIAGLLFLERGMTTASNVDYLRQILPHQWTMARAARPGVTNYYLPIIEENEKKVYRSGAPALELVGHVTAERTVEFSCVLGEGQHLQGWEIFNILRLLKEGETKAGDPVEAVRVVFFEQWMAEQEKRPLLDVGAQVFYQSASGELERVE